MTGAAEVATASAPPDAGRPRKSAGLRTALVAWALAAGLCTVPYAMAHLRPPPGMAFVGAFYFVDDIYNYLGYAQQAADGAFLFRNKLTLEAHAPVLANPEWWLVGRISAALGGRLLLSWRLLGLFAALPFVLLIDAWLRRAGLPQTHRLPALMLVLLGGGLGGLFYVLRWPPALDPLDLSTGLFPVVELISNPHFVCGTALLMGALLLLTRGGARATAGGLGLAALVGLVRPYDLVMVVGTFGLATLLSDPPRRALLKMLPLLGLAPVMAYLGWVFYALPTYRVFAAPEYAVPPLRALAFALGPALALAVATRSWRASEPAAQRARTVLMAWALCGILVMVARPVSFSLQFLVGIGVPLLGLAALGLARFAPIVTLAATLALCSSAVVALQVVSGQQARWFVPAARMEAARALAPACAPGDVALAPRDIGLYALAFTPCTPYASHPVMHDAVRHAREAAAFYTEWDAPTRRAFLDASAVAAVLLPRDGHDAAWWLGADAPFQALDDGGASPGFTAYRRVR